MTGLSFANAWVLYLLWVAPVLGWWWFATDRRREKGMAAFLSAHMLTKLAPQRGRVKFVWQVILVSAGLFLMLFAAARPQWGVREQTVYQRGRDVVIAIDVSRSMLAADVRPSRLERAKADILDLLKELRSDRVALLAFRRTGILLCPLTTDYAYLKQALDTVSPDSAPRGETNIGDAILKAIDAFERDSGSHRAIVLISDGEDLVGKATEAADKAAAMHIPIFTVGFGDRHGARIPDEGDKQAFLKHNGVEVTTKLDNDGLYAIATKTGGAYIPVETASMTSVTLGTLYRDYLSKLSEADLEETFQRRRVDRFQWFLVPGLLLLLAGAFLSRGRLASASTQAPDRGELKPGHDVFLGGRSSSSGTAGVRGKSLLRPQIDHVLTCGLCALLLNAGLGQAGTNVTMGTPAGGVAADGTNATPKPAIAIPNGRDGARVAQKLYHLGRYADAADAYQEAAGSVGRKSERDFLYNAASSLFKAGKYEESAMLFKDIARRDSSFSAASLGLGAAAFREAGELAKKQEPAAAGVCEDKLQEAGDAFAEAARKSESSETARRNLAVVLRELPEAREKAKVARIMGQYGQMQPGQIAEKMLQEQIEIINDLGAAWTNATPSRIQQIEKLAKRQEGNAELWMPLKDKLIEAVAQQASGTNAQQQVAGVAQLAEATRNAMEDAAGSLMDMEPAGHASATRAGAAVYGIWKAVADYGQVLKEDIRRQSNAVSCIGAASTGKPEKLERGKADQAETIQLTDLFVERFEQMVPEKDGPTPPPYPGSTNASPEQAPSGGPEISGENRKKILELASKARSAQDRAVKSVDGKNLNLALTDGMMSYQLLKEIEELLPKDKNQQQQQEKQEQEEQEKKQDEKKQQEEQQEQEQQEKEQEEQQAAQAEEKEEDKKEAAPEDVRRVLEKALQREKEHEAELRRRNQQIPPSPVERDW